MTELRFEAVGCDPLIGMELSLKEGLHVVLGTPADGTAELVALASGIARPRRGRVLLDQTPLHRKPTLRRRVGSLLADEAWTGCGSLRGYLDLALALRQDPETPEQLLARAGLGHWVERRPDSFTQLEARTVALLLALTHPAPLVLALHEPFHTTLACSPLLTEGLSEALRKGAIVLAAVARPEDALTLGGKLLVLERGRCAQRPALLGSAGPSSGFWVQSAQAREWAHALVAEPTVTGVTWNQDRFPNYFWVWGQNLEAVSHLLTTISLREDWPIEAVLPELLLPKSNPEPGNSPCG